MKTIICAGVVLISVAFLLADGPKGTAPQSAATHYAAHADINGIAIGASLLTSDQAQGGSLISDINRCCVVVEIALYPAQNKPLNVSLNDFVLKVRETDIMAKPSSAKVVAARLQRKNHSDRDVTVSPSHGVTSSRGYDPVTGTLGTGITQTTSVMVGVRHSGASPTSTDEERKAMEAELAEKGIAEGDTSIPVAGYVYFNISPKKKAAAYQLEYTSDQKKVVLFLQ
jgi:hypothetical protein